MGAAAPAAQPPGRWGNTLQKPGSAPPLMPLACYHASCWPLGPCDVRGVMRSAPLRSVPPLHSPPSWVLPKGSPPCRPHFALPRSHKYPPAQASHAPARIPGSLPLASSGPLHAPRQTGGGFRLPTVPLRFTAARLAVHPPPRRCSAPRPAASGSCRTPCLRPLQGPPPRRGRDCASGMSFVPSASVARAAASGR